MRLVESFSKIFEKLLVNFGENSEQEGLEYEQTRAIFDKLLAEQNTMAKQCGVSEQANEQARLAVIVTIDELVLSSSWQQKSLWRSKQLQRQYLGSSNGGVEFFEQLQALNPFNPVDKDVREVYYYCLTLGFKGQYYRPEDEPALIQLQENCFEVLYDGERAQWFPEVYDIEDKQIQLPQTPINWWPLIITIPVLITVAFYLYFDANVQASIQKLMAEFS